MAVFASPQAIIEKYNLKEDLEKLDLNTSSNTIQRLMEKRAGESGAVVAEEEFLKLLKSAVQAKHKGKPYIAGPQHPDYKLLQEIEEKLLISLGNGEKVSAQQRALMLANKEHLQLSTTEFQKKLKANPNDPDLKHPLDESIAYKVHNDDGKIIGKILYDGNTLTSVLHKDAFVNQPKTGQEKNLRAFVNLAVAKFGIGTEVSNTRFNEAKFLESRDEKNVSPDYYRQQRGLMLACVSNGLKIPKAMEALLEANIDDRKRLEEARKIGEKVIAQRGPGATSAPPVLAAGVKGPAASATPPPGATPKTLTITPTNNT